MTIYNINVKISPKKGVFVTKRKNERGVTEKALDFDSALRFGFIKASQRCLKMRDLHMDLRVATKYLTQCFYATNKKYSCTRTKLGKLLSIVAFDYAKKGIKLFDEKILKYDGCGTTIKELVTFVDREVYLLFDYSADNGEYINVELDGSLFEGAELIDKCMPMHLKKTIETVFKMFGAYTPSKLGMCINPIVEHLDFIEDGQIDLTKIQELSRDDFNYITEHLEVIDFLFNEEENSNGEC